MYNLYENVHSADFSINLMVRRKKTTLFLNMLENVRVYKIKKMIEGKKCVTSSMRVLYL